MNQKSFTYRLIILLVASLLIIAVFNLVIDSRWTTGSVNSLNKKRPAFDERSQKTNFLLHQKPRFNNLILGSSRASYFPITNLKGKWFNYAVSGMHPREYLGYAKIAEQYALNRKIDTVVIGLDFWATCECAIIEYKSASEIHFELKSWLKQATTLFSYDALNESLRTIYLNKSNSPNQAYYHLPNLVKNRTPSNDSLKSIKLKEQLWYYRNEVFGSIYEYKPEYLKPIKELIDSFPKTHFILYISPVSPELRKVQKELGNKKHIEHWLSDLKTLNADLIITDQAKFKSEMFFDSHHLKPEFFELILPLTYCNNYATHQNIGYRFY